MKQSVVSTLFALVFMVTSNWPVLAGNASYSSESGINATVSADQIGKLQVKGGQVLITGNRIDVLFATADITQKPSADQTALSGVVVQTQVQQDERGHKRIDGIAFFDSGKKLSTIDQPSTLESVTLTDGTKCSGHITQLTNSHCVVRTSSGNRTISTGDIRTINSPRAFTFSIPLTNESEASGKLDGVTSQISFVSTSNGKTIEGSTKTTTRVESKTSTVSHSTKVKRIICVVVLACLIATAIAVPVAVCCANHGHGGSGSPAPVFAAAPRHPTVVDVPTAP